MASEIKTLKLFCGCVMKNQSDYVNKYEINLVTVVEV